MKESPNLYKNKVLSGPSGRSFQKSASNVSGYEHLQHEIPDKEERRQANARKGDDLGDELGNFENPVLGKLAKRTVNKEYETQTIVVNLIALAIWDLISKFYTLFIDNTTYGEKIVGYLQGKLLRNHLVTWKRYLQIHYPFFSDWINWSNLDTLFHLIVVYNVLVSIWRLFSKVKVDDLELTQSQKELLGLDVNSKRNSIIRPSSTITKPRVILDPRISKVGTDPASSSTAVSEAASVSGTPYLFKSLETPLKRRQKEQQQQQRQHQQNQREQQQNQQINLHRHAQSAFVSKVNAFGSLRNNFVGTTNSNGSQTPVERTGYIPSNKYAYMINSPCPRKKM